jgi:hypothetical protein
METSFNQDQLRDLIKSAVAEALEEQRDLLHQVVEEALEDMALGRAIVEGENTEIIERKEVFNVLEDEAWKPNSEPASRRTYVALRIRQYSGKSKKQSNRSRRPKHHTTLLTSKSWRPELVTIESELVSIELG